MPISPTNIGFNPTITSKALLQSTAVSNGSVYFVDDTKELFVDFDSERIEITDILTLTTEAQRTSDSFTPMEKFYYVLETGILWYYKNSNWYSITTVIGVLSNLITTDKSNLVNAINEVKTDLQSLTPVGIEVQSDTGGVVIIRTTTETDVINDLSDI